ncbi:MAG: LamG domain-containing protein, partial [Armatimonadota bacterium]
MIRPILFVTALTLLPALAFAQQAPFTSDSNTLLLYHCDEGQGQVLHDLSGHGQDGKLQGATWEKGRFDGGLRFNGEGDNVFLANPDALTGLKQITVECWFRPEMMSGRRFLMGHDVGFHFEVDDGMAQSISLYNQGGGVPNAEGKPHQQVWTSGTPVRSGRWHHLAITYGGSMVSYFLDGILIDRKQGPKDFSLGVKSRGLWLGCYIGTDYWYSGLMDEVRVSDCVRYDPEGTMKTGDRIFDLPTTGRKLVSTPAVRTPQKTGIASLKLNLRKLHGGDAKGFVYCQAPGKPAAIVGEYATTGDEGQTTTVIADVSDEYVGDGTYLVGLVPDKGGYYALIGAELVLNGKQMAAWSGEQRSRATFKP